MLKLILFSAYKVAKAPALLWVAGRQAHSLPFIRCLQKSPSRWEQQPLCMGLVIIDLVGMHCIGFRFGACE